MLFSKQTLPAALSLFLLNATVYGAPQTGAPQTGTPQTNDSEIQAEAPNWFLELLDREAIPLKQRPLTTADGKLKTMIEAENAAEPESHSGDYFLQLGIGTETPMECWVYPDGHDLAAAHRKFSDYAFESIAQAHGVVRDRVVERIDAGVFKGKEGSAHPYIALDWLYRVKAKDGVAVGEIKHLAAIKGESSVYCRHNETGYKETFQRVFRGLVEHLELADAPAPPFYQEVMIASLSSLPTGVAVTSMTREENGKIKIVERLAFLIPVNEQTLVANDSYNIQFSTPSGLLIDEVEIDSVNGALTSRLRLGPSEGGWKVSGTFSDEELDVSLEGRDLMSILGQRFALRQFLAKTQVGGTTTFADWSSDADPKVFTDISARVLGQGEEGTQMRFDLGPRKMDAVLDDQASIRSANIAMGSLNLKLERVHVQGSIQAPN